MSKQGKTGGGSGNDNGGDSTRTSPVIARAPNGNLNQINEIFRYSQGSRISGRQKGNEDGRFNMGNKGENNLGNTTLQMGVSLGDGSQSAIKEKILDRQKRNEEVRSNLGNKGENISGNTFLNTGMNGGEGSQITIKEKLPPKMGKSIYIGQWDSIRRR